MRARQRGAGLLGSVYLLFLPGVVTAAAAEAVPLSWVAPTTIAQSSAVSHPAPPSSSQTTITAATPTHGASHTTSTHTPQAVSERPPWAEQAVRRPAELSMWQGSLSAEQLKLLTQYGEQLFTARFTTADGVGRPMATQAIIPTRRKRPSKTSFFRTAGLDANACSSCHHQPVIGGAGDFAANVFVSEGFNHADFDSLDPQFSNERNTNHLFGAGLIELLAREMSADLQAIRAATLRAARAQQQPITAALITKGVRFGDITAHSDGVLDLTQIEGVDSDLIIRPFSQKGVMTSLRQFSINALNHHHGMQASERFGARWTGEADFDEDEIADELSAADISALVAWQATLRPPQRKQPEHKGWQQAALRGERLFSRSGCAVCHQPALPLNSLKFADPGRWDMAGTLRTQEVSAVTHYDLALLEWSETLPRNAQGAVMVPLFGDLKRHKIADSEVSAFSNELLSQRFVARDVFMTAELWGIASTAPYGHRGDMTTLDEVIQAHGGAGRAARDAYLKLDEAARLDVVAFLKTLVLE